MHKKNNIIDLKRHPLYIKKLMSRTDFKTFENMLPLDKFNEYKMSHAGDVKPFRCQLKHIAFRQPLGQFR